MRYWNVRCILPQSFEGVFQVFKEFCQNRPPFVLHTCNPPSQTPQTAEVSTIRTCNSLLLHTNTIIWILDSPTLQYIILFIIFLLQICITRFYICICYAQTVKTLIERKKETRTRCGNSETATTRNFALWTLTRSGMWRIAMKRNSRRGC
jgi:hypothetical protein